jgi:hypothetical protein
MNIPVIQKVTSGELLPNNKGTYDVVTAQIEALLGSGNKYLDACVKEVCFL